MDTTVYDFIEQFKRINVDDEIQNALIDTQEDYTRLQRGQLMKGERSDGEPIFNVNTGSDEYSPAYAKRKGKKKPIDLRDKGDFQDGIFVDVRDDEIYIDSIDSKSEMLQETYGEEILGLGEDASNQYADATGNKLVDNIETKLS